MFRDLDSSAIVAVADIDRARRFYEETLELEPLEVMGTVVTYHTGATQLTVYESAFAGSNRANAVVWNAKEDITPIIERLRQKGVTFEQYDMPEMDYRDGIHLSGEAQFVWFRDPDGNILHIVKM